MHEHPTRTTARGRRVLKSTLGLGMAIALFGAVVSTHNGAHDAAGASGDDAIASVALLVPDDRLDPRLVALELDGTAWTRAVERLDTALFAAKDNQRRLDAAKRRLADRRAELDTVTARHATVVREAAGLAERLLEVESILRARALDRYVNFGTDPLVGLADPVDATDAGRSAELGKRVDEVQFSTRQDILDRQVDTEVELRTLVARAVELAAEITSTETVIAEQHAAADRLTTEVGRATEVVRTARYAATVPGLDLSVVALDAYLNAEVMLAEDTPACGLRWWMIAGVARIESRHGRIGGRTLRADGRVDRSIIGIALDGGPGVRAMVDTDGGEFDGDSVWDRAVGPLQFIPETWSRRGRDASGDGYADPQNIYDAAYSAGRYLCALGGNLGSSSSLRGAYFGYNTSSVYVDDVSGHAERYAAFVLPTPATDPPAVGDDVDNTG